MMMLLDNAWRAHPTTRWQGISCGRDGRSRHEPGQQLLQGSVADGDGVHRGRRQHRSRRARGGIHCSSHDDRRRLRSVNHLCQPAFEFPNDTGESIRDMLLIGRDVYQLNLNLIDDRVCDVVFAQGQCGIGRHEE